MIRSEKYLASLLPNFEEKRITSSIDTTRKEFVDTIIPAYERTEKAFVANKLPNLPNMEQFAKDYCPRYRGDLIASLSTILTKVPEKLILCEELVKEHFTTYVTKEGMTFAKANVIRFIEVLDFTGMYARRLLLAMYANSAVLSGGFEQDAKLMGRESSWLNANAMGFFKALSILDMSVKDVGRKFKAIPHLSMVEGQVDETEAAIGKSKTDPLLLGLLPHQLNPIFHIRVLWENHRERQRLAAIEEARQMELYLIILKDDGKVTPAIRREIEHSEGRLIKARRTLRRMEEEADDDSTS